MPTLGRLRKAGLRRSKRRSGHSMCKRELTAAMDYAPIAFGAAARLPEIDGVQNAASAEDLKRGAAHLKPKDYGTSTRVSKRGTKVVDVIDGHSTRCFSGRNSAPSLKLFLEQIAAMATLTSVARHVPRFRAWCLNSMPSLPSCGGAALELRKTKGHSRTRCSIPGELPFMIPSRISALRKPKS